MEDDNFIPLIHNYCDRWCEQCRFIMRCRVGVEEVERLSKGITEPQDVMKKVAENLKNALEMLEKFARESGIDWEELKADALTTETPKPIYTNQQTQLKEWSTDYIHLGQQWFEANEAIFKQKEDELNLQLEIGVANTSEEAANLIHAMEVIRWFLYFISVKMNRAFHGLQNDLLDDLEDYEEDPIQNDANGSAKVALDAIERSLAAWEIIREHFPESTDELIDIFVLLGRMRNGLTTIFPKVNDFVRPGFDEPELYSA